jgi:hypothetical protein
MEGKVFGVSLWLFKDYQKIDFVVERIRLVADVVLLGLVLSCNLYMYVQYACRK